jgi:hypothetical protein
MSKQISFKDSEILSAYLDGQLSDSKKAKVEKDLQNREELRKELDELRETRAILRSAPRLKTPVNFTLTPKMVADIGRKPVAFPLSLSFASALAMILLVLSFVFQSSIAGSPSSSLAQKETAPEAAVQAQGIAPQSTQPSAADQSQQNNTTEGYSAGSPTAPIIYWNGPSYQGQVLGMGGGGPEGTARAVTPGVLMEAPLTSGIAPNEPIVTATPGLRQPPTATDVPNEQASTFAPLIGNGPILGVYHENVPIPTSETSSAPLVNSTQDVSFLYPVRVGLVVVFLLAGLIAIYLWLRRR